MRLTILIMFSSLFYLVSCKTNVKALTESMGQEVIEIGSPIKELPVGLEEEPSAEEDDKDDEKVTPKANNTPLHTTKKDSKKTINLATVKAHAKDIEKIDGLIQDDEEDRIEKELAEIYKDTADYKTDEEKVSKEQPTSATEAATTYKETEKPIARQRNKFQPESTDRASVEKFRTSVDEISCNDKRKLSVTVSTPPVSKNAFHTISNGIIVITVVLSYDFVCN